MNNISLSAKVLQALLDLGVQEFCLCAGARNSPLIFLFDANPNIKATHFFDERSAAFYAIGRMARTDRPVAVITTSGTAVAELLPATIEAYYSGLPLILITADRPKEYRGSGAPQSIEQVGIFSAYVEKFWDLDEQEINFDFSQLSWRKPIHLNICLREPLLDAKTTDLHDREAVSIRTERLSKPTEREQSGKHREQIQNFLTQTKPVVILGALSSHEMPSVVQFLKRLKAPVYAEAMSRLRGHPDLKQFEIRSGEKQVAELFQNKVVNSVLRIGGVPTLRLWRDLEDSKIHVPVLNVTETQFRGLSRPAITVSDIFVLNKILTAESSVFDWRDRDQSKYEALKNLFLQFPKSEPALIHFLSTNIENSNVYLGNSLPIREWDLCACYDENFSEVFGNRGANGIDGQVSTFFGWSHPSRENWCIIGDLTAMYDLSALWIAKNNSLGKLRIVVINNRGGQIFKRMFGKDIFLNKHELEFSGWAKMFGFDYIQTASLNFDTKKLADKVVIELNPDSNQTTHFWLEWEKQWQK